MICFTAKETGASPVGRPREAPVLAHPLGPPFIEVAKANLVDLCAVGAAEANGQRRLQLGDFIASTINQRDIDDGAGKIPRW